MSTLPIDPQILHDKLGTIARHVITVENTLIKQHPDLYNEVMYELDDIVKLLYKARNKMRRANIKITYKNIFNNEKDRF